MRELDTCNMLPRHSVHQLHRCNDSCARVHPMTHHTGESTPSCYQWCYKVSDDPISHHNE